MLSFIKQYWKLILALAYAILVPLFFYQSTKGMQKALDTSRESSNNQITILQDALNKQSAEYDKMFKEYQAKVEEEEKRYNEELKQIRETQVVQQRQLSKRFKDNPSSISDELSKRYNLNAE
jgi:uncharacterized protein HemX